jgi:hypothetical protein
MPPWLTIWFARWAGGERIEKSKPEDYRYWFGVPGQLPLLVMAGTSVPIFAFSGITLWIAATAFGICAFGVAHLWARFIPARMSLIIAIPAWVAFYFWVAA